MAGYSHNQLDHVVSSYTLNHKKRDISFLSIFIVFISFSSWRNSACD